MSGPASEDRSEARTGTSVGARPEGVSAPGGRWAVAAMVALALAAGGAANAIDDTYLASGWHTVASGTEGTDERVGNLQVHVHGAVVSTTVGDDEPITGPGAFVLVDVAYSTTDSWFTPEPPMLIDGDGHQYTEPSGFDSAGGAWMAGPDIWYRGTLLFEVPAEAADDLTIEFRPERPVGLLPSTVLRIPLTVTTISEPLTIEYPTVLAEGER